MIAQPADHRRSVRTPRCHLFVWVTLLVFAGCADSAAPSHLEHLIPPHKPDTLATAAAELRRRGATWHSGGATGEEVAQLADIIEWLPELAADSDVRRAQWERVQAISRTFAELQNSEPANASRQWNDLVDELDEIVRAIDESTSGSAGARDDGSAGAASLQAQEQP